MQVWEDKSAPSKFGGLQVWEDKNPPSKFGRDKSFTWKDVYVEDGKRKVPRGDTEELLEDSSEDSRKRAAEKEATEAKARKRAISFVDIEDESLFEEDLNHKGFLSVSLPLCVCV